MKIGVASDHRGFQVKDQILKLVQDLGHEAIDFGPEGPESVDYPDFASKVAGQVSHHNLDRGILICGTGIGMAITANKFADVRAVNCHDDVSAEMSRRHNDTNVMCISADLLGDRLLRRMIEIWITTEFEGGRHARRVEKIRQIEREQCPHPPEDSASTSCCSEP